MYSPRPGGLSSGTDVNGLVREDEDGEYTPCGCGLAVQRPDPEATAQVRAQDERDGAVSRVFVCEGETCDRRTVQRSETVMEDPR